MKHHMIRMFINTQAVTNDWTVGREVLSAFCEADERLMPEALYQWETRIEDFQSVEQCEPYWAWRTSTRINGSLIESQIGLGWRRKKAIRYQAEINHSHINMREHWLGGKLSVYAAPNKSVDWLPTFRRACHAMKPTYGLLHYFVPLENSERAGTPDSYFSGGIISIKGAPGPIPNLGWATFLGGECAKGVKPEQIAAAGYDIETINDGYLIRITDNINDVADNFAEFSRRRAELKALFPEDFFLIKDEPAAS